MFQVIKKSDGSVISQHSVLRDAQIQAETLVAYGNFTVEQIDIVNDDGESVDF